MTKASSASIGDLLAIRGLIERYCDAVNRRDGDGIVAVWAETGRWSISDAPGLENVVGKSAIAAAWAGMLDAFDVAFFICMPGEILIDGDGATTRSYAQEVTQLKGQKVSAGVGYYEDRFIRDGESWLFAERVWHTVCRYQPQTH